mmetsp:Transcript_8803/g.16069  ORF Transcript_8803/g.16069 Transcript_8803/m.16069 type:complete len:168 (+) Transcript_8803:119-622(+)|eukprot:CAMPEP_0201892168 /NCGR_PEP_ID=MMETSP0902-20130614/35913_1 /ASSEMBLY_ACC=CAM_ASM_000551 /TAXON_ID=420261 /ORGANISM="Thalassiosira antarctica, Strain CCMP982" /LENGTH=167 /DNA_ID=CAMNT_0048423561 /DNA_START=75 /DNA_END=578 /DNA_ORIENTATION=+
MTWGKWDSKNTKKFPYNYAAEERVLILEGSAELTPDDGSAVITIAKGDQVTFHKGFKCKWKVTKRMKKHYTVLQEEGESEPPAITCDVCDVDCVAESYFMAQEEQDICPKCFKEEEDKYAGAEHQKEGEKWVEPTATKKKAAPKKKTVTKKKTATKKKATPKKTTME